MPAEQCPICGITKMVRVADREQFFSHHSEAKRFGKNGVFVICNECMQPIGVRTRVRLRNRDVANPPLARLKDGDEGVVVAINDDSSATARTRVPKTRYDTETATDQLEVEFNIPNRFSGRVSIGRAQLERLPA